MLIRLSQNSQRIPDGQCAISAALFIRSVWPAAILIGRQFSARLYGHRRRRSADPPQESAGSVGSTEDVVSWGLDDYVSVSAWPYFRSRFDPFILRVIRTKAQCC